VRVSNAFGRDGATIDIDRPLPTITTARGGEFALIRPMLVAAFMAQHNGGMVGHPMEKPLSTITLGGCQQQLVAAHLCVLRNNMAAKSLAEPLPTVTSGGTHAGLVAAHLTQFKAGCVGGPLDVPAPTLTARSHAGVVAAFLTKYYGAAKHGQPVDEPLHTVPTNDRFGLVTVDIDGDTYAITDILMRMLTPRELASAMSWPASYKLAVPGPDGRGLSKTSQVRRVGNGVCSEWAKAHVRAALYLD
jgi:DNA (cytosine-5)-methyltransferase 1